MICRFGICRFTFWSRWFQVSSDAFRCFLGFAGWFPMAFKYPLVAYITYLLKMAIHSGFMWVFHSFPIGNGGSFHHHVTLIEVSIYPEAKRALSSDQETGAMICQLHRPLVIPNALLLKRHSHPGQWSDCWISCWISLVNISWISLVNMFLIH